MSEPISPVPQPRRRRPIRFAKVISAALLSVAITAALLLLAKWGWLPEAQDRVLYDWRSYYLTSPAMVQRDDIALIFIDENSLSGYPAESPVNRVLIGEIVRAVDQAGAKVIGLDFIITRQVQEAEHRLLVNAIHGVKNAKIVQAAVSRDRTAPAAFTFQDDFLRETGSTAAHLYFATERNVLTLGDQVVRFRLPEPYGEPARPSFAVALAEAAGYPSTSPPSNYITWQRPPPGSATLFTEHSVRPHRDLAGNRLREPLSPSALASLRDKIVLIGGGFEDRDRHLTPWTIASGSRVPGVVVHAQILAHLIDKRWTYGPEWWWEAPLLILVFSAGFYVAQRWKLVGSGLITSVAAFAVLIAAGIALYAAARILLPSATVVLAWSAGLFFGSTADWGLVWLQRRFSSLSMIKEKRNAG